MRHYEVKVSYDNIAVWGDGWKWGDWLKSHPSIYLISLEVKEFANGIAGGEFRWGEYVFEKVPMEYHEKCTRHHVFTFMTLRAARHFQIRYGIDSE